MVQQMLGPVVARGLAATWKVQFEDRHHLDGLRSERSPFVFALWHCELLPLLWAHRGHPTAILVSQHRDAQVLVRTARDWGYDVIAGSSTRGGSQAVRTAVRVLTDDGEVAITPDGPTGPRHVAKRGVAAASRLSGAPILPLRALVDRAWRLRSWDRFVIPKPFATVRIQYAAPIQAPTAPAEEADALHRLEMALGDSFGGVGA